MSEEWDPVYARKDYEGDTTEKLNARSPAFTSSRINSRLFSSIGI
jgi:hypothetical protein